MKDLIKSFRSYWLRDISFISLLLILAFTIFVMPALIEFEYADMVLLNVLIFVDLFCGHLVCTEQNRIDH